MVFFLFRVKVEQQPTERSFLRFGKNAEKYRYWQTRFARDRWALLNVDSLKFGGLNTKNLLFHWNSRFLSEVDGT